MNTGLMVKVSSLPGWTYVLVGLVAPLAIAACGAAATSTPTPLVTIPPSTTAASTPTLVPSQGVTPTLVFTPTPATTPTIKPSPTPSQPVQFPFQTGPRIADGETFDAYSTTPPTSGPSWPNFAKCGFYEESLRDELIVHNLAHGNIVVNYNLPRSNDVASLKRILQEISTWNNWGVARKYDKIP